MTLDTVVPNGRGPALSTTRISPDEWARRLSGPAEVSSDRIVWPSALMRHWRGTAATMIQPALDHHYIVQHLGGAKLVKRHLDGEPISQVVENGSLTIVPAGSNFKWVTQGPIEFAHLYISPTLLSRTAAKMDRGGAGALLDRVGCRDPLLESLYTAMLSENQSPLLAEPLYLDCLLETFLIRLLRKHSASACPACPGRDTLPKHRVARVKEYVEENLETPITLAGLADIAGGSVYHFSRAFKNAVGDSPYNYVLRRRTERARAYLTGSELSLAEVATACGFRNAAHLSKTFSRLTGSSPGRYRREGTPTPYQTLAPSVDE